MTCLPEFSPGGAKPVDDGLLESDMEGPRGIDVGIDSVAAGSLSAVHVKLDGFRN